MAACARTTTKIVSESVSDVVAVETDESSVIRLRIMAEVKLWLFLIFVTPVFSGLVQFSKQNLYDAKDEIALLNSKNFYSTLFGQDNAWIVQFYNSWCGHCQAFAETWKKLALSVKDWKNVIAVAAIDCSEKENTDICREYDVTAYPTLKFFPSNSSKDFLGKLFEGKRTIELITQSMIEFVSTDAKNPPSSWPDLLTVSHADMNSLWDATPSHLNWAAVVVETPDSYLGRDVILSSQHLRPFIRVTRAIKGRAKFVDGVKNLTAPYMIVIERGGEPYTFTDSDQVKEPYLQHLEAIALNYTKWTTDRDRSQASVRAPKKARLGKNFPNGSEALTSVKLGYDPDTVFIQDFDNVVRYLLWQEVGLQKNITGDKLMALKSFMEVMAKYLPCSQDTKLFLNNVNAWIQQRPTYIHYTQLLRNLEEIRKPTNFDETMKPWIGCQGSRPQFRGYPCGLWVTFHSLTVAAYQQHENDPNYNHLEVVSAIRQYVINFFSCQVCSEHFKNMSSNFENEVRSAKESVQWLWQAHNKVNQRLKGEPSEDPLHPKVEFPSEELCENCRRTTTDDNQQWHLDGVVEFLVNHYSSEIVSRSVELAEVSTTVIENDYLAESVHKPDGMRRREIRPQFNIVRDQDTKPSAFSNWGFGPFDTSLCIVLYMASIGLLIVCYCLILTRRRSCLYALARRSKPNLFV